MAEGLTRKALADRGRTDITVTSAGLYATGEPACDHAITAMADIGIDLSAHLSVPVTPGLLQAANAILVMTPSHKQALLSAGVDENKLYLPSPPIPDPFGGDLATYTATRDALQRAVTDWLDSLIPTVGAMEGVDVPAVAKIEDACFAHPWSMAALLEEVDNDTARFITATVQGRIAGYAGMHIGGDEGFIANVAVDPAFRRQGVGKALLLALLRQGRQESLYRLTLEVRPSNAPAIALYESLGFTCDGLRPGFYRDPTEDAAIYSYYYEKESSL